LKRESNRQSCLRYLPPESNLCQVMNLRNLPWLAGRGYNTTGVYLNNIVHESSGKRGSILSVLFESLTE
jgi:hypothetical protein